MSEGGVKLLVGVVICKEGVKIKFKKRKGAVFSTEGMVVREIVQGVSHEGNTWRRHLHITLQMCSNLKAKRPSPLPAPLCAAFMELAVCGGHWTDEVTFRQVGEQSTHNSHAEARAYLHTKHERVHHVLWNAYARAGPLVMSLLIVAYLAMPLEIRTSPISRLSDIETLLSSDGHSVSARATLARVCSLVFSLLPKRNRQRAIRLDDPLLPVLTEKTKANRVLSPCRVSPGFLHVGIVLDDAAGRQVFSGISRFRLPFVPALLHSHLDHPLRFTYLQRKKSVKEVSTPKPPDVFPRRGNVNKDNFAAGNSRSQAAAPFSMNTLPASVNNLPVEEKRRREQERKGRRRGELEEHEYMARVMSLRAPVSGGKVFCPPPLSWQSGEVSRAIQWPARPRVSGEMWQRVVILDRDASPYCSNLFASPLASSTAFTAEGNRKPPLEHLSSHLGCSTASNAVALPELPPVGRSRKCSLDRERPIITGTEANKTACPNSSSLVPRRRNARERVEREIPEKTRKPAASPGAILTCEYPGASSLGNRTWFAWIGGEMILLPEYSLSVSVFTASSGLEMIDSVTRQFRGQTVLIEPQSYVCLSHPPSTPLIAPSPLLPQGKANVTQEVVGRGSENLVQETDSNLPPGVSSACEMERGKGGRRHCSDNTSSGVAWEEGRKGNKVECCSRELDVERSLARVTGREGGWKRGGITCSLVPRVDWTPSLDLQTSSVHLEGIIMGYRSAFLSSPLPKSSPHPELDYLQLPATTRDYLRLSVTTYDYLQLPVTTCDYLILIGFLRIGVDSDKNVTALFAQDVSADPPDQLWEKPTISGDNLLQFLLCHNETPLVSVYALSNFLEFTAQKRETI
ncbi:hypothetical protein PR048_024935 [Dryococelus australis]|uniref:Uncharacterized protein n=1 Tax=Dryococelus australis TaxID=614101 RepID=A0ABQ9GQ29_9NEOP|nr:hypothetical protein PR048_024935 [Dryococelus australis]